MLKKTIVISIASAAFSGMIVSFIVLKSPEIFKETLPNWLSALGTISAVWFAVASRTDKAKIVIDAKFLTVKEFRSAQDIYTDTGESSPLQYIEDQYNEIWDLTIYFSNLGKSTGLITEWGIVGTNGEEINVSSSPIVIEGFGVETIKKQSIDDNPELVTSEIYKYKNNVGEFRLYFKEVNGKVHFQDVTETHNGIPQHIGE